MKNILLILILGLLFGCKFQQNNGLVDYQSQFANMLDIKAIPESQYNLDAFGFSDMGAWHAYTLPNVDSTSYLGGFCGPLLMKMHGQWMGKCMHKLVLKNENGKTILYNPQLVKLTYLPGKLVQELDAEGLQVKMQLIFTDKRTALISAEIKNSTNTERKINLSLEGDIWLKDLRLQKIGKQLRFILPDDSFVASVFQDENFNYQYNQGKLNIEMGSLSVKSKETKQFGFYQSYCFSQQEFDSSEKLVNVANYFQKNTKRWNNYFKPILNETQTEEERWLVVKCVQTLISNWRSSAGALKHNGVFPSVAYQGFYGFWSWDSWKHAVALAKFHPELAKESIRSMFDFQNEAGMVADCVYFDPKENNWRDTKAPLSAWAVWEVFQQTADTIFAKEIFPKLVKYHQWWYNDRDHDKNGICEYGSTDGTLIAAKWESGMDNAVRFDETEIVKIHETAWSFNQESVDLNAYLQKEKEYLSFLAEIIGKNDISEKYKNEAKVLAENIRDYFWCEKEAYFFDKQTETGEFVKVYGPEGWTPLWTQLASQKQAEKVIKIMLDSTRFYTKVSFPTLDASHDRFNPLKGYWRGPVWIDQAYFGIESLRNYGMNVEAEQTCQKMLQNCDGLLGDYPIHENYHPLTGERLNARHFSWSAAHLLLLTQ